MIFSGQAKVVKLLITQQVRAKIKGEKYKSEKVFPYLGAFSLFYVHTLKLMKTANLFDIISLLFNYSQRYRVEGDSMLPTLKNGDMVLVKLTENLQIGDIVVAKHPYRTTPIIKRITDFSTGGKLFLSGDNPDESSDSRVFGEIDKNDVLGKVICRLS